MTRLKWVGKSVPEPKLNRTYVSRAPTKNWERYPRTQVKYKSIIKLSVILGGGVFYNQFYKRWNELMYKVFRLLKSLSIQGVCFYCTGSLLVGGIAPTNREPVYTTNTWMNKVLESQNTLHLNPTIIFLFNGLPQEFFWWFLHFNHFILLFYSCLTTCPSSE